MTVTKRKVSVSLDEDLVAELEQNADGNSLSTEINEAIRGRVEMLAHQRALRDYLDRLDDEDGPLTEGELAWAERFFA